MQNNNHEASRRERSQRGRVLVIDDDTSLLVTITNALRAEGYQVLVAASYAALRLTARTHPDMVLLGIIPPLHNAIAISTYLRANPITAHVPIIAMATRTQLNTIAAVMPINGRLQVPFDLSQLSALVARWIPAPASPGDERAAHDAVSEA